MVTLYIDFQDGFAQDTVVFKVNDKEVYHKRNVSTKLLLGKAASFNTKVETGTVNLEINVQRNNMVKAIPLEISADTYIGISIVNGKIEYIVSVEPFGYL
jgi:hypothetical protein